MELFPEKLVDLDLNIHRTSSLLGQGGQGVVFKTRDPNIAIKVATNSNGAPISDPEQISKFKKKLNLLKLLPLPAESNVSMPVVLLRDHVGYVMQFMGDMLPFSSFFPSGSESDSAVGSQEIPEWLGNVKDEQALKYMLHYLKSGGLRRRLIALYKFASNLARLHARGLVYGDVSPNNAYISQDQEYSEVWLIDPDNIRFEVSKHGSGVFTPGYGAPELVTRTDVGRSVTDTYAFAVMAFNLLSMIHPFLGKAVYDDDDSDWASEETSKEDQAFAGQFPWVDDPEDRSNSNPSGWPRELILSEKLFALFRSTFGEGRLTPWRRPAIYQWPQALAEAADHTLLCPSCEMTYFHTSEAQSCPYCGSMQPEHFMFEAFQWTGNEKPGAMVWTLIRENLSSSTNFKLPQRLLMPFSMAQSDRDVLEIMRVGGMVEIRKRPGSELDLHLALPEKGQEKCIEIHSTFRVPISNFIDGVWLIVHGRSPRLIRCTLKGASHEA